MASNIAAGINVRLPFALAEIVSMAVLIQVSLKISRLSAPFRVSLTLFLI